MMRIDATRWEGPALLGLALAKAGHYEEALTSLNQAINLARPEKQTALRQFISDVNVEKQRDVSRTADTQFQTADFRSAASSYYSLWRSHLNQYDLGFNASTAWRMAGDPAKARSVLDEILRDATDAGPQNKARELILIDNASHRWQLRQYPSNSRLAQRRRPEEPRVVDGGGQRKVLPGAGFAADLRKAGRHGTRRSENGRRRGETQGRPGCILKRVVSAISRCEMPLRRSFPLWHRSGTSRSIILRERRSLSQGPVYPHCGFPCRLLSHHGAVFVGAGSTMGSMHPETQDGWRDSSGRWRQESCGTLGILQGNGLWNMAGLRAELHHCGRRISEVWRSSAICAREGSFR